jgi:hypothetical protein
MRLFPDNQKCNDYNQECILALKMPICKINAICNPPSSSRIDEEHLSGLRKTLYISINSKIILVTNM